MCFSKCRNFSLFLNPAKKDDDFNQSLHHKRMQKHVHCCCVTLPTIFGPRRVVTLVIPNTEVVTTSSL
jgi:hypothetical protein